MECFQVWVSKALLTAVVSGQYTVKIYNEYLSQNGRTHFENDRWDNHNVLDQQKYINHNKEIGTEGGRWLNRDLNGDIYKNTPQDPHRHGYPDPNHFKNSNVQKSLVGLYKEALDGYGKDLDVVMCLKGKYWPHWLDTSHHGGIFPNNVDAGAEFAVQMLDGIQHQTGGILPPYFEVINEPDTLWQHVNWQTVIEFHKVTAQKLKAKFPKIKVGGPTYTAAVISADKNDFRVWKTIREFLDMSLYHMDFFSFHPYTTFHSHGGSHWFSGAHESRLVGLIDLLGSYSRQKRGFSVPLIVSEFGLGRRDTDSQTSGQMRQWAYAYMRNTYMFTFLNHRDIMEVAIGFIISHAADEFKDASLYDNNNQETFVAKTFRFWKHFYYNQQFRRVESQYNNAERTIVSHAVADPHNKKVTVLLHNYKQSAQQVKLDFHNNWITPYEGQSTCMVLDSQRHGQLHEYQSMHMNNHVLTIPSEGSCFYTFQTGHNFGGTPTVKLETHYAKGQALAIHNNVVQTTINVPNGGIHSAQLRFGVSTGNKHAHTKPTSVQINGHTVNGHYSLHDTNKNNADTLWDMYVYSVPTNDLKHGDNTIRMQFAQSGGYVSTAALLVGTTSGNGNPVGHTVKIYNEYLSQNGRIHFENDRWDNHNGLDRQQYINHNKEIGTEAGRWMNRDLNGDIYKNTPQDPHRHGYPDPNHFKNSNLQRSLAGLYNEALNGYGKDLDVVMVLKGKYWPHWLDTSHHGGIFPNNLDAGAEFAVQMLDGIQHQTGGVLPPYFEVINEPDTLWQHVNWQTVTEFHKVTAQKLKAKFPKMKVGGPTYTEAVISADKNDFRVWKSLREFLDMSLYHMDFFSFHPYTSFHSHGGSHWFSGAHESRLVGLIDLLGSYSRQKRGFSVPLIVSEFGLGGRDTDSHTSGQMKQWAYAYMRNAYMFTFLNHRDVMERAVGFILSHDTNGFEDASLYDNNNHETFVAKTFRFWKHFYYNQQFLRVESQYNNAERTIVSHAVADPHNKKVTVLLHNYKQSAQQVKLDFHNNWVTPSDGQSTCMVLDSQRHGQLHEYQSMHLNNHVLTIPSEGSCFYTFQTGHNFGGTPTVKLETHYAKGQALAIHNNVVQTTINVPNGGIHSAQLRFGVSTGNKHAHTKPTSVQINGHTVNGHYSLHDTNKNNAATLWDMYVYSVPTGDLKHGDNTIRMQFAQSGGYVSTAALLVGTTSGNGNHVG